MKRLRPAHFLARLSFFSAICLGAALLSLFLAGEVYARVGGGQSYGGGGHGGSDGGGAGAIIGVVRLLVYLTIEYPAVGVPVDIIVIGVVIYRFTRRSKRGSETFSSASVSLATPLGLDTGPGREGFARAFDQLRRFDPNFSEIVFTDFCYSLYAKAQDARGHGVAMLDQFSPYLSEPGRKALLQRNPPGLQEVKGIIVGAMTVA